MPVRRRHRLQPLDPARCRYPDLFHGQLRRPRCDGGASACCWSSSCTAARRRRNAGRSSSPAWASAACIVYDFYLYSDAMLFRALNADIWAARGMVNALAVPLIAVSAARNPKWSLDIAVSRRVMFHSAAAVRLRALPAGDGAGRLLPALLRRQLGLGDAGGLPVAALVLLAGIAVLGHRALAGSRCSSASIFTATTTTTAKSGCASRARCPTKGPDLGERAMQAMADLVESPAGALWLSSESRHHASCWRTGICRTRPAASRPTRAFCSFLQGRQWVVDLDELRGRPGKIRRPGRCPTGCASCRAPGWWCR